MAIDWLTGSTASIFESMGDAAMPFVEESAAAELMSGASRFAPDAGVFGLLSAADHYSDLFHMAARAPAVLAGLFSGMSLGASDEFVQSANNVGLGLSTLWTPGGSKSNVEAVKIQTLPVDSTFNGPNALTTPVLDESARHQTTSFLPTNLLGLNRTQGGAAPLRLPTAMYADTLGAGPNSDNKILQDDQWKTDPIGQSYTGQVAGDDNQVWRVHVGVRTILPNEGRVVVMADPSMPNALKQRVLGAAIDKHIEITEKKPAWFDVKFREAGELYHRRPFLEILPDLAITDADNFDLILPEMEKRGYEYRQKPFSKAGAIETDYYGRIHFVLVNSPRFPPSDIQEVWF